MKKLSILLITFLLSCGNQENINPVLNQSRVEDTICVNCTKNGISISLNEETAKKFIAPATGVGLYKTHKEIYASSVDDLAKNIRTSTLGHISQPRSLELAHILKKKAANKVFGKFTFLYTIGTTAFTLIDINSGENSKSKERFMNNSPKKD